MGEGISTFNKYFSYLKESDFYYLATIFDPRIKTEWIKKNIDRPNDVIERIRDLLYTTYPTWGEGVDHNSSSYSSRIMSSPLIDFNRNWHFKTQVETWHKVVSHAQVFPDSAQHSSVLNSCIRVEGSRELIYILILLRWVLLYVTYTGAS